MNTHKNAPLTPEGRARMVRAVLVEGFALAVVARMFRISRKTVAKWVRRFRDGGPEALQDRSSRPRRTPSALAQEVRQELVRLRKRRLTIPEVAHLTGVALSTAWRWLRRAGLGRLRPPQPDEPVRRYERRWPGELIHVDVKKLARFDAVGHRITGDRSLGRSRGAGHDCVHVAIDDHSRLAYVEVHRDEKAVTAIGFVQRAFAWYRKQGIRVQRLMSDNGSCYRSKDFNQVLRSQGVRHIYTRPYTPKTNGKAERFIQTMTRNWAYSRPYETSVIRNQHLACWLRSYNERRPHRSNGRKPPVSRVPGYNLVETHS